MRVRLPYDRDIRRTAARLTTLYHASPPSPLWPHRAPPWGVATRRKRQGRLVVRPGAVITRRGGSSEGRTMRTMLAGLAATALVGFAGPAAAEIRALVVAISQYKAPISSL